MSASPPTNQASERLAELATGFALGDLNKDELGELHEHLQGDAPAARKAAATCWSALETTVDLRAAMDHSLPDTVVHRIANPNPQSFIGGVFGRLGFSRPRLKPIKGGQSAQAAPSKNIAGYLVVTLVVVLVILVIVLSQATATTYSVREVGGIVRLAGQQVQLGHVLDDGLLTVPTGGRVVLEEDNGTRIILRGPSDVVLSGSGIQLPRGNAHLTNLGRTKDIDTPHGEITVPNGATIWLRTKEHYALVGSRDNGVRINDQIGSELLPAGFIRHLGVDTYPWIVGSPWRDESVTPLGRPLAIEPETTAWRIELRTIPSSATAGLRLHGNNQSEALIHLIGKSVTVDGTTFELSGAPLQPRRIIISRLADGRQQLRIDGATGSMPLKLLRAPLYLASEGDMHLDDVQLITGIDPGLP